VPLRFPRPVVAAIATGMASVWLVAGSSPAFADQVRQQEWWLSALNVSHAWPTSRGAHVTVAVLSDGVDAGQADISRAVTVGPDYTGANSAASTFVGLQGTPIASLIAGRGHGPGGASGIVGVAPKARILSIRVTLDPPDPALDSATIGAGLPDAIASGIRYAVAHHATVIDLPVDPGEPTPGQVAALPIPSIPFGLTQAPQVAGLTAAAGGSSAERAAIAFARRKGVVLVAPAGDNAAGTDAANYPAAYPGVIAVGAFDQSFALAAYSSRQSYVALTASGAGVLAAKAYGGYEAVNSTSAASAVVSGIAALVRSRYPSLSAAQVSRTLTGSTVYQPSQGSSGGTGSGSVDAQRALAVAAALTAPADARAGAGAAPLAEPAKPGLSAVTSDGLAPRVLRAAIISAGALILLLLLIAAYTAVGRRRDRKDAAASAEWVRSTQNAFSPYGTGDADKMLEYFAAPAGAPAAAAGPFPQFPASQYPARSAAEVGVGAAATAARAGGAAAGGSAAAGSGTGAWVPLGPASRAQSRQPRVSGTPPWEPASEPDSELPWASVPGPAGGGTRPAASPAAAAPESVWPATTTAAASPTGHAWDDLAASSRTASPATTEESAAAPPFGTPSFDAPSSGPPSLDASFDTASFDTASFGTPSFDTPTSGPSSFDAEPGSRPWPATSAFASGAPASGGTLFDASPPPRSPSGSDWELPGSDPKGQTAAPDDAQWQSVDSDAYRPPASASPSWQATDGDSRDAAPWPPAPSAAPWESADSDAYPTNRAARWQSTEDTAAPSAHTGQHRLAPADTADAGRTVGHERWEPTDPASQWQPAAPGDSRDTAPRPPATSAAPWEPAPEAAPWEPTTEATPWESAAGSQPPTTSADSRDAAPRPPVTSAAPWERAAEAEPWEPASDAADPTRGPARDVPLDAAAETTGWPSGSQETDTGGWPSSSAGADTAAWPSSSAGADTGGWPSSSPGADTGGWPSSSPGTPSAGTPAEPAAADVAWNSPGVDSRWDQAGADSRWESAGTRSRWDSLTGAEESPDGDDQLFAWRPTAQTETFPAIDDE
jgi:hypothetical protein